ncbi:MAG: ABC transporter ATP-binding protein [Pegethrix bostrychoides GSE-TBD4-15B]|uniref:ABC transporter ATP-binding protein n=1 Tax=Pegethrix bostrychoides GSE-TBD4-15B TaxID=2839662 RepID=A0A951PCW4_9CYAN|nr:ABC transporter ATP-binding protein [Pegethrix bostrychoides GSE-TBD4-15B]
MAQVVLDNIYKSFPQRPSSQSSSADAAKPASSEAVLRRIGLTVEDGEFMVLVGPSGCGKSTLLRLIAGLETVTGGDIWVANQRVNHLPPKQRDIAMVFQSYALYPHLSVYDNLAFGLRRAVQPDKLSQKSSSFRPAWIEQVLVSLTRRLPPSLRYWSESERQIDRQVRQVAQQLQIEALLHRLPRQLSGGQKQRVALGRAMARQPQVFLMDEPLSNLDAKLRTETRAQIVSLQRQLGVTTIYVTHDQVEAMTMGDRIAVMNAGQIQQVAAPLTLYHQPANRFVAEFIGSPPMNFLTVQLQGLLVQHSHFRLTLPAVWEALVQPYSGRELILGIRPEHLSLSLSAPRNLPVQVSRVEALGSETYLTVNFAAPASQPNSQTASQLNSIAALSSPSLQVRVASEQSIGIAPSSSLWLELATDKLHLFDPDSGLALRP